MLAKIDSYSFEVEKKAFNTIAESFKYDYAEHKKLDNYSSLQSVGKYSQELTISGVIVAQKMSNLDALIKIAEKKQEARFSTIKDDFQVIIANIQKTKKHFNKDGSFMSQAFSIKLKRVFS